MHSLAKKHPNNVKYVKVDKLKIKTSLFPDNYDPLEQSYNNVLRIKNQVLDHNKQVMLKQQKTHN